MSKRWLLLVCVLAAPALFAAPVVTDWDEMIPAQAHPARIMERYGVRYLDLSNPDEKAIFDEIETARREGPVVPAIEGREARLRGFVVPLDGDGAATTEFLLVPDYGYCIHVPPPPANQLILVRAPHNRSALPVFSEVEVEGTLHVEQSDTGNGRAGYTLQALRLGRL